MASTIHSLAMVLAPISPQPTGVGPGSSGTASSLIAGAEIQGFAGF
jgi:hypothetical protein